MYLKAAFNPDDPLRLEFQLLKPELDLMIKVREKVTENLVPLIQAGFRQENQVVLAAKFLGELAIFGGDIAHLYGGPSITPVAYGLIARELERADSGFRAIFSVMGRLVMKSIYEFGSAA